MRYVRISKASEVTGLCINTLRKLCDEGKIKHTITSGGHRRIDISQYLPEPECRVVTVGYCRVSSAKQKDDLDRQVEFLRTKLPEAEIVKDIGSGINFKRKGLATLLERAMSGEAIKLVVAYRDRIARFGFDVVRQVIERSGGSIVVLNDVSLSPEQELTQDLCSIIHVFSCRLPGLRRYKDCLQKDTNLSNCNTEDDVTGVVRDEQICV